VTSGCRMKRKWSVIVHTDELINLIVFVFFYPCTMHKLDRSGPYNDTKTCFKIDLFSVLYFLSSKYLVIIAYLLSCSVPASPCFFRCPFQLSPRNPCRKTNSPTHTNSIHMSDPSQSYPLHTMLPALLPKMVI